MTFVFTEGERFNTPKGSNARKNGKRVKKKEGLHGSSRSSRYYGHMSKLSTMYECSKKT